jgi:hypothetical protein
MVDETAHPSDEALLLFADGELSRIRTMFVRRHLEACWNCRARIAAMEQTIGDFVKIHHHSLDPQIPPIDGPRALLKLQLSTSVQRSRRIHWWSFSFLLHPTGLASFCALALGLLIGGILFSHTAGVQSGLTASAELLPDRGLTPGAARPVAIGEICAMDHDAVIFPVSGAMQKRVFQEYGLGDATADNYEVDYLISPGLGGTDDIRNLWPEPRYDTAWNSFVKDQLEDYLHRSVCTGKVDLATAQKDLSTNWISAYRKYFKTNEPVGLSSSNSSERLQALPPKTIVPD